MDKYHKSVLLHEAVTELEVKPDGMYIDATLGGGGHTREILNRGGKVLALDADRDAIEHFKNTVQEELGGLVDRITVVKANYRNIDETAGKHGYRDVSGILFDLGVSGYQLDTAERGFSFSKNAVLDMRMDTDLQVTAKDLLMVLTKKELYEIFKNFGEERFSAKIAENIINARRIKPVETTAELEAIVNKSVPFKLGGKNSATRVFQALRIAVNDELGGLEEALPKALNILISGGRIVIITFHSLEDRIAKNVFSNWEREGKGKVLYKKPIQPGSAEVAANYRARSAKLRVFIKA